VSVEVSSVVFKQFNVHRRKSFNLGGIICLILTVFCAYHFLIQDKLLPFCIYSVLSYTSRPWHLLIVGLVPIYIACMIFGAAIMSLSLGSALQRWLTGHFHD
jgi:hypothetical protein